MHLGRKPVRIFIFSGQSPHAGDPNPQALGLRQGDLTCVYGAHISNLTCTAPGRQLPGPQYMDIVLENLRLEMSEPGVLPLPSPPSSFLPSSFPPHPLAWPGSTKFALSLPPRVFFQSAHKSEPTGKHCLLPHFTTSSSFPRVSQSRPPLPRCWSVPTLEQVPVLWPAAFL